MDEDDICEWLKNIVITNDKNDKEKSSLYDGVVEKWLNEIVIDTTPDVNKRIRKSLICKPSPFGRILGTKYKPNPIYKKKADIIRKKLISDYCARLIIIM